MLQKIAIVLGAEIITERRSISVVISKQPSESRNDTEDQHKGADQENGIGEVDHFCLLCTGVRDSQKRLCRGSIEVIWSLKPVEVRMLVNPALASI